MNSTDPPPTNPNWFQILSRDWGYKIIQSRVSSYAWVWFLPILVLSLVHSFLTYYSHTYALILYLNILLPKSHPNISTKVLLKTFTLQQLHLFLTHLQKAFQMLSRNWLNRPFIPFTQGHMQFVTFIHCLLFPFDAL